MRRAWQTLATPEPSARITSACHTTERSKLSSTATTELERDLPDATFEYEELVVDGEFGLLGWTGLGRGIEVPEGADASVVRDGRIVAQIVHYHVHH